jgi:hypothetical protein
MNNTHICVDEDGLLVIRDIKNEKQFKKLQLEKDCYKLVKLNHVNENQFYVVSENKFSIYDLRTYQSFEQVEEFKNCSEVFNDSESYLLMQDGHLNLYSYTTNTPTLLKDFDGISNLKHLNCNLQNYNNPDIIILGNNNGDLFYSNIE